MKPDLDSSCSFCHYSTLLHSVRRSPSDKEQGFQWRVTVQLHRDFDACLLVSLGEVNSPVLPERGARREWNYGQKPLDPQSARRSFA